MAFGVIFPYHYTGAQGSEQTGLRPVLVVKELGESYIIASLSTKGKAHLPVHLSIEKEHTGLKKDSILLLEQLQTVSKTTIKTEKPLGSITHPITLSRIQRALKISLGI